VQLLCIHLIWQLQKKHRLADQNSELIMKVKTPPVAIMYESISIYYNIGLKSVDNIIL
jgi:hypothetical protein